VVRERELPLALRPPKDQYTYNLYLEAVHMGELWESPSAAKAISNFREVIHRAPDFAPAYVGLSTVLTQSGQPDVFAESESLARQALAKNNAYGPAHAALAHTYWRQWKWDDADVEFRKALDLDANDAMSHQLFGLYLVSAGGDAREAVEHGMRAIQIEPTSGLKNHTMGNIYLQTHQYDLAIQQEMKTLEILPRFPQAYERLGNAYLAKGMIREAQEALDKADSYGGKGPVSHIKLLIRSGRLQEARSLLAQKPYRTNRLAYAGAMASLGDISGAFEVLNDAVARHEGSLVWIKTMPELEVLRSDERYRQVLTQMGFH
jgi:tetratricopeptide (TPR) repeat protein